MYKRIILMILVIGFLSCNPVSADNLITNGDFETGDFSGWTVVPTQGGGQSSITVGDYAYSGDYGCRMLSDGYDSYGYIRQQVNFTDMNNLTFRYKILSESTDNTKPIMIYIVGVERFYVYNVASDWVLANIDVSSISGLHNLDIYSGYGSDNNEDTCDVYIDDIGTGDAEAEPYITWSTWPSDSWAVGNYSMITVGLPRPPDPVDFYIKTPSTDYIKKPLTKSPLVKVWNYEESQWYYQYFHSVYHSQYGDYSCKIVNSSADFIEYSNITVPYSSPDVPIPPVISIPIPDSIEAPPVWNVIIPEPYENVSWIFNYTDFWDDIGITFNDTLYSTVGLIFIPMESINESVHTVYTHVNTAADMVSGSEHTHIIVQVAWDVIPDSIKTIFVGAAAIGLCIFILHRRT